MANELDLQAKCFQWYWNTFIQDRQMLFHVQQKAQNAWEGSKFKAIGVVKGVSDLIYIGTGFVAFIELKAGAIQSPEQKIFEHKVIERGHMYYIVRSLSEFQDLIYELRGITT